MHRLPNLARCPACTGTLTNHDDDCPTRKKNPTVRDVLGKGTVNIQTSKMLTHAEWRRLRADNEILARIEKLLVDGLRPTPSYPNKMEGTVMFSIALDKKGFTVMCGMKHSDKEKNMREALMKFLLDVQ